MLQKNANKRAIGIGVSIGLVCVAISFWKFTSRSTITLDQLSERSQQFLTEHGKDVATQEVEFGDEKGYEQNHAYDRSCYSFQMPFKSKLARVEDPDDSCTTRLLTKEPISRIAIQVKATQSPLAEDPAITMRRANSDQYSETAIKTAKFGTVLRFDSEDAVTIFWQTAGQTVTIGFTGLTDPATVDVKRLTNLIESFQLVTKPEAPRTYETPFITTAPATQSAY